MLNLNAMQRPKKKRNNWEILLKDKEEIQQGYQDQEEKL